MSEENQDILTYRPIQEWTGYIVDFGMPTHDGNKSLTEIVTSSNSALEATKRAMELSFFSDTLAPARSPEKLEIVRMFFGGDIGGNLAQLDLAVYEEALISHFIESFFSVSMPEFSGTKSYLVSWAEYKQGVGFVDFHQIPHITDVRNPIGLLSNYGTVSSPGNWDWDGMPWLQIWWDPIADFHCTDPTHNNQTACEASVDWGYCRTSHNSEWSSANTPPLTMRKDDGYCFDVATDAPLTQYDGDYSQCTASSSRRWEAVGPVEANIDLYNSNYYCEYADTYNNGIGKCFYQTGGNSNTAQWHPYSAYSGTEDSCMNLSVNNPGWHYLYWMWLAPGNTWTEVNNKWLPDPDTVAAHQHYNLLTSDNHRHLPAVFDSGSVTAATYYYTDTHPSFGNGLTDGRSIHPWWVTNTFEWLTDDCSDTTSTVTAGAFVIGNKYTILTINDGGDPAGANTDFTAIGAANNDIGTTFIATGVGTGTGTATYILTTCVPYTHDVAIDPDYYTIMSFGPHAFVNTNSGDPQSMYGYQGTYFDYTQIRWRPPQYNYDVSQRAYPPPDYYRIYRSPYWSPGGLQLTDSDYQVGIWKLVGEVAHNSDNGYHYFQDPRLELANIGIEAYQTVAYNVTPVWEKWNWKRGLTYSRHYGYPYQWDPALYEYLSGVYVYGDLNWATTGHAITGAVIPSPDIQYEDFAIRLDDNTTGRFHRHAGYFRAAVTGLYAFHTRTDDSGYLWMAMNTAYCSSSYYTTQSTCENAGETWTFAVGVADQSVSTLEGNRTAGNALCAAPGLHGDWLRTGYINLVAGAIYPILSYNGNNQGAHTMWLEFTPPGGSRTFDGSDHFYPESGIGAVNPSANDGQFVEGGWSNTTVFSSYRN